MIAKAEKRPALFMAWCMIKPCSARNLTLQMRVRHILEYIENGEMVGKDVLEYDASTDKWHRVEAECIELV